MFTIAVIGHRPNRLPAATEPKVRAGLARLLNLAQAAVAPAAAAPGLAVLTSLAEGADRIGAEQALKLGLPLHVVLPLPRADYEQDFADDASRAAFRGMLAAAGRVVELGPPAQGPDGRDRAYKMSADILLDHADLLVAIWDGAPPAGRGGTAMTIDDACARGIPVVVIDARGEAAPRLIWHGLKEGTLPAADPDMLPHGPTEDTLPDVMRRLIGRPAGRDGAHHAMFLGDSRRHVRDGGDALATAHRAADQLATTLAGKFRRAVVWNFVTAFCAIACAVTGLALLKVLSPGVKLGLLATEFALLAFIIVNTSVGRWGEWHRRWIEYREIAERLRVAMLLRAVAARAFDNKGDEPRWVGFHVRQSLRAAGLPSLNLDQQGLTQARDALLALARDQRAYHERAAHRAHAAERWNEGAGTAAFLSAFLVAMAAIVLMASGWHGPDWLKPALSAAAIILPALGSALLGIRLLADYAGVAERSREAARTFGEIARHLDSDPLDLRHLRARAGEIASVSLGDVMTWRVLARSRKLDWPG